MAIEYHPYYHAFGSAKGTDISWGIVLSKGKNKLDATK